MILGEKKDLAGAVHWCRKAHDLRPEEVKYTESLAYYLTEKGDNDEADAVLKKAIQRDPRYFNGSANLAGIHESRGERTAAARVLRAALRSQSFRRKCRGVAKARRGVGEVAAPYWSRPRSHAPRGNALDGRSASSCHVDRIGSRVGRACESTIFPISRHAV